MFNKYLNLSGLKEFLAKFRVERPVIELTVDDGDTIADIDALFE